MYVKKLTKSPALAWNAAIPSPPSTAKKASLLDLGPFLQLHDYDAALVLLRVQRQREAASKRQVRGGKAVSGDGYRFWRTNTWWVAYCEFQRGNIADALVGFDQLLESQQHDEGAGTHDPYDPFLARDLQSWRLSRACCLYYLRDLDAAEQVTMRSPRDAVCNRLLYLLAHAKLRSNGEGDKQENDQLLMNRYEQLAHDSTADQLAVAFASYERGNIEESIDIYKRLVSTTAARTPTAIHVYLALCYFRLEYFDVATELLAAYLESCPGSAFATNLLASCRFRAESDAASVIDDWIARFSHHPAIPLSTAIASHSSYPFRDVIEHNHHIFRESVVTDDGGDPSSSTESTLRRLMDAVPEARLNLALLYLRRREFQRAFALVEDVEEPELASERMVKAAVHGAIGEQTGSRDHVFLAEKLFHAVGSSPVHCDTLPGRESMASYHILRREFTDALIYLESISAFLSSSSAAFNWNYGLSLAATGNHAHYAEAREALARASARSPRLASDWMLNAWLARCYVLGTPSDPTRAWEIYLRLESSNDAFRLLRVLGNDLYRAQSFYLAAKAFDVLERLDPDPELWEAKRGACLGFMRQVATGDEPPSRGRVDEVMELLATSNRNTLEASALASTLASWSRTLPLR